MSTSPVGPARCHGATARGLVLCIAAALVVLLPAQAAAQPKKKPSASKRVEQLKAKAKKAYKGVKALSQTGRRREKRAQASRQQEDHQGDPVVW